MKRPWLFPLMLFLLVALPLGTVSLARGKKATPARPADASSSDPVYKEYLVYFEEVYALMDENYYFDLGRADFDRFLEAFDEKIYPNLQAEGKSVDYVRWRSSAYLVDFLKQPDDIFSRFLPPKPAAEFAQEVYGQKLDLGIEGHLEGPGFVVDLVEPRSNAYELGLREGDLIVQVDGEDVNALGEAAVRERLVPLVGARVRISYLDATGQRPHVIEPESRKYYKQTVFLRPTGVRGIFCLELPKFNRKTNEDMARFLEYIAAQDPKGLVLDLRGNPGGPPLAALAISAFFLPNDELFAYFEGRHRPRADLEIPRLPDDFHFDWPMVILADEGSGSASELFSGILQKRGRAVVMGQDTAGQVLLKSLFDLSDGSTLAMVTARGYFPDGTPFPFDGVKPDEYISGQQKDELVTMASKYLFLKAEGKI